MIELFKLNHTLSFPSVNFALEEPNGLLAFGGDLSPARLVAAYKQGIFPWYNAEEPILWWSPTPRAIIHADQFNANKTLKKSIRKYGYKASLNARFNEVIEQCSSVARRDPHAIVEDEVPTHTNTWISNDMLNAYKKLHLQGYAHSVEITNHEGDLVGGLYGVVVSGIFCGESMFHLQTDASKAAFLALSLHMRAHNMSIIDCQLVNPHLERLGCIAIQRNEFLSLLKDHQTLVDCWQPQNLSLV
ncbi:MAG: leucyl/phenylalanyl-tRNA--protein transferase [Alphaproteobacteria bacterium]|jgi:leucyl/phenylalanyl-tRNA--protein transferase